MTPAPARLHLPFEPGVWRMAMGLTAVAEPEWLEIDDLHAGQVAQRRAMLADRRDDVFAAGPTTGSARAELLEMLAGHLVRTYPAWFSCENGRLRNHLADTACDLRHPDDDPLALAARLVQEDFLLLTEGPEGPVLDSAILCFPARWRLRDKLGRPLMAVHAPVPFYAGRLGRPVDRFFGALKPGRLAARLNWSVMDSPELYQTAGHGRTAANSAITRENAGTRLWLRVERQTFLRMPQSGVQVFGIHTHVTPLSRVAALPGEAARLAAAVRALPDEMARYKSVQPFRAALLAFLENRAAEAL